MPTKTILASELTAHAHALTHYAAKNAAFAHLLHTYCTEHLLDNTEVAVTPTQQSYLTPREQLAAEERLAWLFSEVERLAPAARQETEGVLQSWSKTYIEPKDQIFGFVGIAIIGPTLGLVKKKKKKKSTLRVVITSDSRATATRAGTATLTSRASAGLLSESLAKVGGDAYRLDPELADWLFTDQETKLSQMPSTELQSLALWLKTEQLPHYAVVRDGTVIALAVAPCVTETVTTGEPLE